MQETIREIQPKQLSGGTATHLTYSTANGVFTYHLRNANSVSISSGPIGISEDTVTDDLLNYLSVSLGIVII
jgi:hypothetical protein